MIKKIIIAVVVVLAVDVRLVAQPELVTSAAVRLSIGHFSETDKRYKSQMDIVIKTVIVNKSKSSIEVAAGLPSGGSGDFVAYRYTLREVNGYIIKPSVAKLGVVKLNPGEAAELEEWVSPIFGFDQLPDKVTVVYDSTELREFGLCWSGRLEAEYVMDIPAIKKRLGEK